MGIAVTKLTDVESYRGSIAAWLLISFGFGYFIWGVRRVIKNKPHTHLHLHGNGSTHYHTHAHREEHSHVHQEESKKNLTPWILFTIFVFGPCEPLIPILMYPAAKESISGLIFVASVFGGVTILTMMTIIIASSFGISFMPLGKMEKYSHALAGAVICLSGLAIQFLGL
jgi:ABC-type nickel/cobalt efflux system permease component RcnA